MSIHELPSGFKDEEKWMKFFPKRSFVILAVTFGITVIMYKLFDIFHIGYVGGIIGGILILVCVSLSMIPVPYDEYMKGGGQTLDRRVLKVMYRKSKKNKAIYVKRYTSAADVVADAEEQREYMLSGDE